LFVYLQLVSSFEELWSTEPSENVDPVLPMHTGAKSDGPSLSAGPGWPDGYCI
jgi:hypothetical protein